MKGLGLVLLLLFCFHPCHAGHYHIGILSDLSVNAIRPVSRAFYAAAFRSIHNQTEFAGTTFDYAIYDDQGDSGRCFIGAVNFALNYTAAPSKCVDLIVGPDISNGAANAGAVGREFGVPILSPTASSAELSDKVAFPTFSRMQPDVTMQADSILSVLPTFGWTHVVLLGTKEAYSTQMQQRFADQMDEFGVTITSLVTILDHSPSQVQRSLQAVKESGCFIVVFTTSLLPVAQAVAEQAKEMGLFESHYVWLTTHSLADYNSLFPPYSLCIYPYFETNPLQAAMVELVLNEPGYDADLVPVWSPFLAYRWDTFGTMARAFTELDSIGKACGEHRVPEGYEDMSICERHASPLKEVRTELVLYLIRKQEFEGASLYVKLDPVTGNRLADYGLYQDAPEGRRPIARIYTNLTVGTMQADEWAAGRPVDVIRLRPGDTLSVTVDAPWAVLAFGLALVGCWTSLILLEQVISNPLGDAKSLHRSSSLFWLALSAVAAAVGVWGSCLIAMSALQTSTTQTALVSFVVGALAVNVTGYVLAFYLVHRQRCLVDLSRHEVQKLVQHEQSAMTQSQQTATSQSASASMGVTLLGFRKRAAWLAFSPVIIVASLLITGATACASYLLIKGFRCQATLSFSPAALIAGIVVMLVLAVPAVYLFFFFRKSLLRIVAAFLLGFGGSIMNVLIMYSVRWTYTGRVDEAVLSLMVLRLIGTITIAAMCFAFIGLNITKLRLSKDLLDRILLQSQKSYVALQQELTSLKLEANNLAAMLNMIHLLRPLQRRQHFAVTTTTTTATNKMMGPTNSLDVDSRNPSSNPYPPPPSPPHPRAPSSSSSSSASSAASSSSSSDSLSHVIHVASLRHHRYSHDHHSDSDGDSDREEPDVNVDVEVDVDVPPPPPPPDMPLPNVPDRSGGGGGGSVVIISREKTQSYVSLDPIVSMLAEPEQKPSVQGDKEQQEKEKEEKEKDKDQQGKEELKKNQRITLQDLLANPITLEIFKDVCLSNHNPENMAFWLDVREYTRAPPMRSVDIAKNILRNYVVDDSPFCINISETLRKNVLKRFREHQNASVMPQDLFREAQREVFNLMVANDYKRFIGTFQYQLCATLLQCTASACQAVTNSTAMMVKRLKREMEVEVEDVQSFSPSPSP